MIRKLVPRGAVALALLLCAACGLYPDREAERAAAWLTGRDPGLGRERIGEYGCGACHTIPGVPGARGKVGPPLAGIASRMYVGGVLVNSPANLMRWIRDAPAVDSLTAMPDLGVTARDARDIAAYLYTLR